MHGHRKRNLIINIDFNHFLCRHFSFLGGKFYVVTLKKIKDWHFGRTVFYVYVGTLEGRILALGSVNIEFLHNPAAKIFLSSLVLVII